MSVDLVDGSELVCLENLRFLLVVRVHLVILIWFVASFVNLNSCVVGCLVMLINYDFKDLFIRVFSCIAILYLNKMQTGWTVFINFVYKRIYEVACPSEHKLVNSLLS